jgi:hypothetical protein
MNLDTTPPLPNYRRASERWPQAPALAQYHGAISSCIAGKGHGVVEHVKSFIECVCITILGEFGEPLPSSDPTSTELLVAALRALGFQNSRGASKLDKVLSAFNRLADALSEMRNENGPVAHGKDGFLDAIEADHARAFLHAGDAIVGLLLNALEGKQPNLLFTREPYERFKHLCNRIDRSVGIEADVDDEGAGPMLVLSLSIFGRTDKLELRIEPSRLLYGVDRTAFVEVLSDAPAALEEDRDNGEEKVEEPTPRPTPQPGAAGAPAPPKVVAASEYSGMFADLRAGLRAFVIGEGISLAPTNELLNSMLAAAEANSGIDWQTRENLQARMKVGFRRVLSKEGIDLVKATDASERLLTWLKVSAPADTKTTPP